MGAWLMMCLPGMLFVYGAVKAWVIVGMMLGMIANWIYVGARFRDYNTRLKSRTIPEFLAKRFGDNAKHIRFFFGMAMLCFLEIYLAAGLMAGAKVLSGFADSDYTYRRALAGICILLLVYALVRHYLVKQPVEYFAMLAATVVLVALPAVAMSRIGIHNYVMQLVSSGLEGTASDFLNAFGDGGSTISLKDVFSQISWGLGFCGMPHILMSFSALKDEQEHLRARRVMIAWSLVVMVAACVLGMIARAYLYETAADISGGDSEMILVKLTEKLFVKDLKLPAVGILITFMILFVIFSHAELLLHTIKEITLRDVAGKSGTGELYELFVFPCAIGLALIFAFRPTNTLYQPISFAWAGLGAALGPVMLLSLFWGRMTHMGAYLSMFMGGTTVIFWDLLPLFHNGTVWQSAQDYLGIYSLPVAFAVAMFFGIVGSLITHHEGEQVEKDFRDVKNGFLEEN